MRLALDENGELYVYLVDARISEEAARIDDLDLIIDSDRRLYVSVEEAIEWHEESISEREIIVALCRVLLSHLRGELKIEKIQ